MANHQQAQERVHPPLAELGPRPPLRGLGRQHRLGNAAMQERMRGPRLAQAQTGTATDAPAPGQEPAQQPAAPAPAQQPAAQQEARANLVPTRGAAQPDNNTPSALGTAENVDAATIRTGYANNPRAQAALDSVTNNASFRRLTAQQQGWLLQQFQAAPNAATAQFVNGLATYHANGGGDTNLPAYRNALNPDGGSATIDGTAYTVRNGELRNENDEVAGDIRTDGTYRIGEGDRQNWYENERARVTLSEGTGRDARTLVDLHDSDPNGVLRNQNMNPRFVDRVRNTQRDLRRENIDMRPTDGFRSFQDQDNLYAQGRTRPGNRVTNARGGYSFHNYGVAVDQAMVNAQGQPHWNENGEYGQLWQRYGELGERNGLEWGGRWRFTDNPHLEYHPGLQSDQSAQLRAAHQRGGLDGAWRTMGIGRDQ